MYVPLQESTFEMCGQIRDSHPLVAAKSTQQDVTDQPSNPSVHDMQISVQHYNYCDIVLVIVDQK
jgi:hypothetical protein